MAVVRFTAVHVRSFLGLTRTEFQRWMGALPPLCHVQTQERNAREFSIRDLAFFAAVQMLQRRLGVPLRSISTFSGDLYRYFQDQPLVGMSWPKLHLGFDEAGMCRLSDAELGILSLAIDTAYIWQSVHRFVGIEGQGSIQQDLPFGLVALERKAKHG